MRSSVFSTNRRTIGFPAANAGLATKDHRISGDCPRRNLFTVGPSALLIFLGTLIFLPACQSRPQSSFRAPQELGTRAAQGVLPEKEPYVRIIHGEEVDPSNLHLLSSRQAQGGTESDDASVPILDQVKLDEVHFSDMALGQAVVMLTRMIGQNVVASSMATETRVHVYLRKVTARGAIEGLCRLNGLWYREDAEMIRILTKAEYGQELVIKSDEQTRLYYLKNASALGVADMIASLMSDQVEYNRPREEASFGHVGTDGDDPLASNVGTSGGGSSGSSYRTTDDAGRQYDGSTVSRSSYNYSLSDVTNNFQKGMTAGKIEQLTKDVQGRQKGEISAQTVAEKTGVKARVTLSVFLRNNCIGVRTVQESVHSEIGKIIEALDTPTRQVLLEVKVLSVSLGEGLDTLFKLSYANGNQPTKLNFKFLDGADLPANTVSFGYLDKYVTATMQALQNDKRMQLIATPMLMCANNAPAEFFSGVTRMITTNYDYETRYAENNRAVDIARPVVTEREIGTKVRIKPSINADGTVTLRFLLEIGTVNEGGGSVSQVKDGALVKLPIDTVDNNKIESIVVASHGQAVVMGGLISDGTTKSSEHVPLVGKVPVLGTFFGQKKKKLERAETVVIIIPHIIGKAEFGQKASDHLLKRNATHPWVTHDQESMTKWSPDDERLEQNKPKNK
jgi:general secretion pathway protein D